MTAAGHGATASTGFPGSRVKPELQGAPPGARARTREAREGAAPGSAGLGALGTDTAHAPSSGPREPRKRPSQRRRAVCGAASTVPTRGLVPAGRPQGWGPGPGGSPLAHSKTRTAGGLHRWLTGVAWKCPVHLSCAPPQPAPTWLPTLGAGQSPGGAECLGVQAPPKGPGDGKPGPGVAEPPPTGTAHERPETQPPRA